MALERIWRVNVDAAMDRQHARVGLGMVVWDARGRFLGWGMGRLHGVMSSQEAEYAALVWALAQLVRRWAWERPRLIAGLDNEVVVKQMQGLAAVRQPSLQRWWQQAQRWARCFPEVRFVQLSREENRLADAIAHAALRGGPDVDRHQLRCA